MSQYWCKGDHSQPPALNAKPKIRYSDRDKPLEPIKQDRYQTPPPASCAPYIRCARVAIAVIADINTQGDLTQPD
jgi:hypothetical protein